MTGHYYEVKIRRRTEKEAFGYDCDGPWNPDLPKSDTDRRMKFFLGSNCMPTSKYGPDHETADILSMEDHSPEDMSCPNARIIEAFILLLLSGGVHVVSTSNRVEHKDNEHSAFMYNDLIPFIKKNFPRVAESLIASSDAVAEKYNREVTQISRQPGKLDIIQIAARLAGVELKNFTQYDDHDYAHPSYRFVSAASGLTLNRETDNKPLVDQLLHYYHAGGVYLLADRFIEDENVRAEICFHPALMDAVRKEIIADYDASEDKAAFLESIAKQSPTLMQALMMILFERDAIPIIKKMDELNAPDKPTSYIPTTMRLLEREDRGREQKEKDAQRLQAYQEQYADQDRILGDWLRKYFGSGSNALEYDTLLKYFRVTNCRASERCAASLFVETSRRLGRNPAEPVHAQLAEIAFNDQDSPDFLRLQDAFAYLFSCATEGDALDRYKQELKAQFKVVLKKHLGELKEIQSGGVYTIHPDRVAGVLSGLVSVISSLRLPASLQRVFDQTLSDPWLKDSPQRGLVLFLNRVVGPLLSNALVELRLIDGHQLLLGESLKTLFGLPPYVAGGKNPVPHAMTVHLLSNSSERGRVRDFMNAITHALFPSSAEAAAGLIEFNIDTYLSFEPSIEASAENDMTDEQLTEAIAGRMTAAASSADTDVQSAGKVLGSSEVHPALGRYMEDRGKALREKQFVAEAEQRLQEVQSLQRQQEAGIIRAVRAAIMQVNADHSLSDSKKALLIKRLKIGLVWSIAVLGSLSVTLASRIADFGGWGIFAILTSAEFLAGASHLMSTSETIKSKFRAACCYFCRRSAGDNVGSSARLLGGDGLVAIGELQDEVALREGAPPPSNTHLPV